MAFSLNFEQPIRRFAGCAATVVLALTFVNFPTQPVAAIGGDQVALREFQERLQSCPLDDRSKSMDLAAWAVENELLDEADQLLRDHLDTDPSNEQARAALIGLSNKRKLPADS